MRRTPRLPNPNSLLLLRDALEKGAVTATLRGGSMTPCIPHLSEVTLMKARKVRVGDVVAARVRGTVLVHRVVDAAPGQVCLQGDALARSDGWIALDDVIAIAVRVRFG